MPDGAEWWNTTPPTTFTYFGFTGDPVNTFTSAKSNDGLTWTNVWGAGWVGQINAPQVHYDSGTYYFHVAKASDGDLNEYLWYIGQAAGGVITTTATVDWSVAIPGLNTCYSGEWFDDAGTTRLFVPCSTGDNHHFKIYETHSTAPFTSWSSPVLITVTGDTNMYDPKVFLVGGTYYMWLTRDTDFYVELASASSALGPYTMQRTGDWAGWGSGLEGPTLYQLTPTTWRIAVEPMRSFDPREHFMQYSDCDNIDFLSCTWTALLPWHVDQKYRHGSIRKTP